MSREISNKIFVKLERLDEYLEHLREIQKVNKKSFLRDYHFYGLAERYLQLSIEVLMDTGKLIILSEGFRRPEDNQEIFEILGSEKVLSASFARRLSGNKNPSKIRRDFSDLPISRKKWMKILVS